MTVKKSESWSDMKRHMDAIDRLRREYDAHNKESERRLLILETKITEFEQRRVAAYKRLIGE